MNANKKNLAKIEALLFVYGEPMEIKKIGQILDLKYEEVIFSLNLLKNELLKEERGLMLIEDKERVQLATKPDLTSLLESMIKEEFSEELTPAALETLSIIAYTPFITRAELEYIRGVNSSFILRSLLMRGLIERSTHPKRANAYIYSVSFELLKRLGVSSVQELPDYKKYNDLMKILHPEDSDKSSQNKSSIQDNE